MSAGAGERARLGFLGVGWIGRHRMRAMLDTGVVDIAAIADPSADALAEAGRLEPSAQLTATLDEMLSCGLDGVVIATPSALHASQSIQALERGVAVFCQKPLGRNAAEAETVVAAARKADRLLGVDLSYRYTEGLARIRDIIRAGGIGRVFAADLVFHNAYGPDKNWFYDRALSGGGCVMDLGVHLVDMALWVLDSIEVATVSSTLFCGGEPFHIETHTVEDYAVATLTLANGAVARIACSWRLHAGRDAVIEADFFGTQGGLSLRNVGGSFYDFRAERFSGTAREVLCEPPDEWGGRAAADWARRLAQGRGFEPNAEHFVAVSQVLDRIYEQAG